MKKKLSKRTLTFFLTLAMVFALLPLSAFANESKTDPVYNHGTISVTADGNTTLDVGESVTITVSPYIHMQYQGCQMDGCPEICGAEDCFVVGKGCGCTKTPTLRTAAVTAGSSDESVAVVDDSVTAESGAATTVGDTLDGTIEVTAVGEGSATITVTASLCDWVSVTKRFTVTVGDDSGDTGDMGDSGDTGDTEEPGEKAAAPTLLSSSLSLRATGATTGTTSSYGIYLMNGSSDWAENVTSVTLVDLRDGSERVLSEDLYTVTASKIALYRTDEDPILSITTEERSADFEIIVTSTGYEDMDEVFTATMYGAQTFTIRYLDGDGNVIISETFTKDEIIALSQEDELYYNTICDMTGLRSFRAKGVYLTELLDEAGIDFSEGMTMVLRTNDQADGENDPTDQNAYYSELGTFTYEEIMGTPRYAFTDIFTNETLKSNILAAGHLDTEVRTILGSQAQKEEVYPAIAYNYVELQYPQTGGESVYNYDYSELTGYENCFRFLFGIAMDDEDDTMISGTTTTWSAAYAVFGIDIIDENYEAPTDTLAMRRGNVYYFQDALDDETSTNSVSYGKDTDEVLVGDWDGDGVDTICVRRGNKYYFSNDRTLRSTTADYVLTYGKDTDEVIVGDWDGDGVDTLGVRRGNRFLLTNDATFESAVADVDLTYGSSGDEVLIGDWDGDGCDTLMMRRGNKNYVCNDLETLETAQTFTYGRAGDTILVGDWNGNGADSLAVRRGNSYYFNYSLKSGTEDLMVKYGKATDQVLAGTWRK